MAVDLNVWVAYRLAAVPYSQFLEEYAAIRAGTHPHIRDGSMLDIKPLVFRRLVLGLARGVWPKNTQTAQIQLYRPSFDWKPIRWEPDRKRLTSRKSRGKRKAS